MNKQTAKLAYGDTIFEVTSTIDIGVAIEDFYHLLEDLEETCSESYADVMANGHIDPDYNVKYLDTSVGYELSPGMYYYYYEDGECEVVK